MESSHRNQDIMACKQLIQVYDHSLQCLQVLTNHRQLITQGTMYLVSKTKSCNDDQHTNMTGKSDLSNAHHKLHYCSHFLLPVIRWRYPAVVKAEEFRQPETKLWSLQQLM